MATIEDGNRRGVMIINPHNVSRYTFAGTSRIPFNAIKATYAESY